MPLSIDNQLFNCALVIQKGKILGVVPKTYIPNYNEFYEQRWFSSSLDLMKKEVEILGQTVPIGTDLIFRDLDYSEISFGIEICEDLWSVLPPSQDLALNGAHLLFNLSSSNELIGKYQYRRSLVSNQSSKLIAGYVYTSSGVFESSSDVVFSGHALISENGAILTESKRFQFDSEMLIADIDVFKLHTLRMKDISYMGIHPSKPCREIMVHVPDSSTLRRDYERFPFVPHDLTKRTERCHEIFQIQACGLAKRLHHIHCEKTVIGISGGLDSTLAFLVIVEAYKKLGISTKNIVAITMPGFGTTKRTLDNALKLMKAYDVEVREIPIVEASLLHMKDIGHDPKVYDVAYENIQARERTQILMDVANEVGGIVVGTGDLSELALGWCTYNGDHMSMYAVNNSIPKTLVKYLVRFVADSDEKVKDVYKELLKYKYGFILRRDIPLNRVSTPTKLSSYLANGVIPIYSTVIESFKEPLEDKEYAIAADVSNLDELYEQIVSFEKKRVNVESLDREYEAVFDDFYNETRYKNNLIKALDFIDCK